MLRLGLVVVFLVLATAPGSLAGQDPPQVRVVGTVVDGTSGAPLIGAQVVLMGGEGGVLTDDSGSFMIAVSALPRIQLRIDQLGYAEKLVTLSASELDRPITIRLDVDPIALEGLDVVVAQEALQVVRERMERRRRAYVHGVRAIPRERMLNSAAASALDFIRGFLPSTLPCSSGGFQTYCLNRGRGRTPIKVCIDGNRPPGGFRDLQAYNAEEFDSVEIYGGGRLILVYTRRFMERAMTHRTWIHPFPELAC